MGMFADIMNTIELAERVARGEGQQVKEEILGQVRADREKPREEAAAAAEPCTKAPPGYKCLGIHDERGRCMSLEVLGP